jgi:hypothetical protein
MSAAISERHMPESALARWPWLESALLTNGEPLESLLKSEHALDSHSAQGWIRANRLTGMLNGQSVHPCTSCPEQIDQLRSGIDQNRLLLGALRDVRERSLASPMKGALLVDLYRPQLRTLGDLDLWLADWPAFVRAARVLGELGFHLANPILILVDGSILSGQALLARREAKSDVELDMHFGNYLLDTRAALPYSAGLPEALQLATTLVGRAYADAVIRLRDVLDVVVMSEHGMLTHDIREYLRELGVDEIWRFLCTQASALRNRSSRIRWPFRGRSRFVLHRSWARVQKWQFAGALEVLKAWAEVKRVELASGDHEWAWTGPARRINSSSQRLLVLSPLTELLTETTLGPPLEPQYYEGLRILESGLVETPFGLFVASTTGGYREGHLLRLSRLIEARTRPLE